MARSAQGSSIVNERVRSVVLGAKESWTRRMFEQAAKLRELGGGPVHDLSLGNPSLEPPDVWKRAVVRLLHDEPAGMHRYMTNAGFAEIRSFVAQREADRYGLPFVADDVVMTVGAAGAVNVLLGCLLEGGDEVVVPAPYFTEYDHYCDNARARLVAVTMPATFALDVDAIVGAIGERTRVLLINSPNNPTGAVYSAGELARLANALTRLNDARARPLVVIEDSPYRDLMHDRSLAPSILPHYEHAILVTSHSKDLGLAGERIGYLLVSPRIAERELLRRGAAFCNRVLGFVNAPALMQRALPEVLGDPHGRVDVDVYARRCQKMAEGLRSLGFALESPKAGFFLFPRLPERLRTAQGGDVELTDQLLTQRTIVVPGTAFGVPGYLRLSMATEDVAVEGALAAFGRICGASS